MCEGKLLWQLMEALSEIKCNVPEGKDRAVTAATTPHSEHHALKADKVEQVERELGSMCPSIAAAFECSSFHLLRASALLIFVQMLKLGGQNQTTCNHVGSC